jgi:trigger factor
MSYQLTKRMQHRVEIAAEFGPERVEKERNRLLKGLRNQVSLPGFRAGKVPLNLIRARFGAELKEQLVERLAQAAWEEVLDGEEQFYPVSAPNISSAELKDDDSFVLAAEVELRPVLELPSLDGLTLPEISTEVAEAEIDAELEKLQKEQASWEPADDEPAEDGMRVVCTFRGEREDDGEVLVDEDDASFIIGHPELYPEISEAMQGATTGDQRSASKRFPDDDPDEERAGKTVRFDVTVKNLKREVLPELDDELAQNIGLDSLSALRERIGEVLGSQKVSERQRSWRRALLDQLGEGYDVNDLPNSLVQNAIGDEIAQLEHLITSRGGSSDSLDRQELAAKIEPQARRKVLDLVILEQLADELEVTAEHLVEEYVRAEASRLGIPPAEHKAKLAKEKRLDSLRHSARISETVNELIRRAGGEGP